MTALDQSHEMAVLAAVDSNPSQHPGFGPADALPTGLDFIDCVQRLNPDELVAIAQWHERRALDHDRLASNAETTLWRAGCERRASFHRVIGAYLRALHSNLLTLREIVLDGGRQLPFADSTPVAPREHVEQSPRCDESRAAS